MADEYFDVAVVGFGFAAACAAIAAAEQGARVLIVDRALGGGASAVSGGVVYAGGGPHIRKAAGYDDSPNNVFDYLRWEVGGVVDDDTLRRFCDDSANQLAWLESHGARFDSSLYTYKTCYPTDETVSVLLRKREGLPIPAARETGPTWAPAGRHRFEFRAPLARTGHSAVPCANEYCREFGNPKISRAVVTADDTTRGSGARNWKI
jgi:succinate dehydrogenase/fumarate reductase flavoprotein subunit